MHKISKLDSHASFIVIYIEIIHAYTLQLGICITNRKINQVPIIHGKKIDKYVRKLSQSNIDLIVERTTRK